LPLFKSLDKSPSPLKMRTDVNHSSPFSHHLTNPRLVEFQCPLTPCQPVIYRFRANSSRICLHALHILSNHHGFQLAAGLPCALSAKLLACFVGSCPRRLARPACRHKRCVAAPLAADRQQATQRVQTRKETLVSSNTLYRTSFPLQISSSS